MDRFSSLPWIPLYTQSQQTDEGGQDNVSVLRQYALAMTVAFTVFVYALEGYLDARQMGSYQDDTFPESISKTVSHIDKENKNTEEKPLLEQLKGKFEKAQGYGLDKIQFGMVASLYDVLESLAFLLLGAFPFFWDLSVRKGGDWFGWSESEDEIKMSLIFIGLVTVVGTVTSLPFGLYSTFQIERKHGFNKMTLGLYAVDKIKELALTALIGGPFVSLLLYIIKAGGEFFYLYVWAFMFVFSLFMMTIVPVGT